MWVDDAVDKATKTTPKTDLEKNQGNFTKAKDAQAKGTKAAYTKYMKANLKSIGSNKE